MGKFSNPDGPTYTEYSNAGSSFCGGVNQISGFVGMRALLNRPSGRFSKQVLTFCGHVLAFCEHVLTFCEHVLTFCEYIVAFQ